MEKVDEKQLLNRLERIFNKNKPLSLKKVFAKVNLSTKRFKDIWSDWWEGELPPREEVDLIFVFSNSVDVILLGAEVEFFRGIKESPYRGLEQALSFSLFGFDSLLLWHVFATHLENSIIEGYVKSVKELTEGLNLPITYMATKIHENDRFEFFAPFLSSYQYETSDLLNNLGRLCKEKRNPLTVNEEVQRRRNVLKLILQIPR